MPADIRLRVEAAIRLDARPQGLVDFLRRVNTTLRNDRPETEYVPAMVSGFARTLAQAWDQAGLRVGGCYDGVNMKERDGSFQRFARAALLAFRDPSRISRPMIWHLKRDPGGFRI